MPGKLIICPTPIGNLDDMTPRAIAALREADVVCAEDTRVTGKLLAALEIEGKRLERLDENVVGQRASSIVSRVQAGEVIAYCTDAGMPGVSDPGLRLVSAARAAHAHVEVLPGPTAAATAYVASGTTAAAFYFGGFFPRKSAARRSLLQSLKQLDAALVFYESPNRIASALQDIAEAMPNREVAVCRELTKIHEEVVRGASTEVARQFESRSSVKGEIVIVIDAATQFERDEENLAAEDKAKLRARELAARGERPKQVAKLLSDEFGIARNSAYDIALAAKEETG